MPLLGVRVPILCGHDVYKLSDFNVISNPCNILFYMNFKHVHRERNHIVDHLAKQRVNKEVDLICGYNFITFYYVFDLWSYFSSVS